MNEWIDKWRRAGIASLWGYAGRSGAGTPPRLDGGRAMQGLFRWWDHMSQRRQVYCVLCSRPGGGPSEYSALEAALRRCPDYCRVFDGVWLVLTPEGAGDLYQRLVRCFSGNDQCLILEVGEQSCDWLPDHPKAARWLRRYV